MRENGALSCEQEAPALATGHAGVELRILSGCHQGARLAIAEGQLLRVGSADDGDVLLSDCGLPAGAAIQVVWRRGRWSVLPVAEHATATEEGAARLASHALGAVARLGQVSATVCAEKDPWPVALQSAALDAAAPLTEWGSVDLRQAAAGDTLASAAGGVQTGPPKAPAAESRNPRAGQLAALALAIVILGAGWAVWRHAPAAAKAEIPAKRVLSPQAQDKAMQDASLAIALVDPTLRLRVQPNAEGGVTVSGWVDNVEQFDRLAQGLSGLRPLPRLAVRTASEVLDALADAGWAQGVNLQFSLMGSGRVEVKGVVATPPVQQQLLAQLRARAPEGIEIVDGLRVAALQGPAIRQWLESQGLAMTQVDWDGEQLVLGMDVSAKQRVQLERLLAATPTPLTGVPFALHTRIIKNNAAQRIAVQDAGLPFRIRSVVSGEASYVVLADGVKLQPGGERLGWRLVSIAPDHLVFDGPKRLEISR